MILVIYSYILLLYGLNDSITFDLFVCSHMKREANIYYTNVMLIPRISIQTAGLAFSGTGLCLIVLKVLMAVVQSI